MVCSEEILQNLDSTKHEKKLDRRKRDTTNENKTERNIQDKPKNSDQKSESSEKKEVKISSSIDDVSEVLDESESNDDVQRRTRQLRPSLLSNNPWKHQQHSDGSSSAYSRAFDYPVVGSLKSSNNHHNYPTATAGLLYKSDGRFYPTNPLKSSSSNNDFKPVISTYSGNSDRNKYFLQNFHSPPHHISELELNNDKDRPKYKQSSKIAGHTSSSLFPLTYTNDARPSKDKYEPHESHDNNYSYFLFGKNSEGNTDISANINGGNNNNNNKKKTDSKAFNYQVTNSQLSSSSAQKKPFVSFGGFFNNNQDSFQAKPVIKQSSAAVTKTDTVNFTPIKSIPKSSSSNNNYNSNKNQSFVVYKPPSSSKNNEDKIFRTSTIGYEFNNQPFVSSTPKVFFAYSTPNQIFNFDKFIAGIRESQKHNENNENLRSNSSSSLSSTSALLNFPKKSNKGESSAFIYTAPTTSTSIFTPSTTESPDEYYYDDDDDEETTLNNPPTSNHHQHHQQVLNNYKEIPKTQYQSFGGPINNKHKQPSLQSNLANTDDYYYDYSEYDYDEEEILPPPANKSKYTPMTETMAPRPLNITTLRPFHVSGRTFTTSAPPVSTESLIPSIIKFPEDVFQSIPSFNSQKSKNSKTELKTTTPKSSSLTTSSKYRTTPKSIVSNNKSTDKPTTTKRKTYTSRPINRGNSKFKTSTKRPDRTRLDIDDKLYNRYNRYKYIIRKKNY